MAAPEQIPTFKLVLVGDGGTGKVRFDIEAVGLGELVVLHTGSGSGSGTWRGCDAATPLA